MRRATDLAGKRFGSRVVIASGSRTKYGQATWACRCDCGAHSVVRAADLTKSKRCLECGRGVRHGHNRNEARTGTYRSWTGMMTRCTNPEAENYARYGGRGITVCRRWYAFKNFLSDMGDRPSAKHSIDRIKNDRGYEPGNCRWATDEEQRQNRRRK